MTSGEVVAEIIGMVQDFLTFMLPIIGVLAGLTFVLSFFFSVTMGLGRRTFRG